MSTKDNGGPAFPFSSLEPDGSAVYKDNEGMTLRDYFASKALQGLLSAAEPHEEVEAWLEEGDAAGLSTAQLTAKVAYTLADAMMAERERA